MTIEDGARFRAAIAAIDAVNAGDPAHSGLAGDVPPALSYGQRMSRWLLRLNPDAPEALRLAVRAQHIARWEIPRSDYPADREGYLRWRSDLARHHGERTARILHDAGYEDETIDRVRALIRKTAIKRDPDAQTLEDAACLVFLETQFTEFSRRHPDEKVIDILKKTWAKMSPAGREHAVALVDTLPRDRRDVVERALAEAAGP